ncbi:hypothetical protein B4N89_35165 [Embleya scabrispora]|uniref:Uncharacterized protein n=2 Tax=Embleya scabrispora TaxID=159449 RepID=A0A1T3NR77_9ACTN|nr:hypothetical protein B4N89_35165 [Embleya scabrispora]
MIGMTEPPDVDALEASFSGGRATLGQRVDATRAQVARTAEPPRRAQPGPPPPAEGTWVWVRQPEDRGVLLCRVVRWERTASGAWALRVDLPIWAGFRVPGGYEVDGSHHLQIAPTHALIEIPGQDYSRIPRL